MDRLFQGAATVDSVLRGDLIERAADAGLRSLFVGFETLSPANLAGSNKRQNLGRDYAAVADRLHGLGIMINGSFVFGMDDDERGRVSSGRSTGPSRTASPRRRSTSRRRIRARGSSRGWRTRRANHRRATGICYDTRHVVYQPARLTPAALEAGYWRAYREFYRWSSIARASHRARLAEASGQALLLRGGMEEVRAAVGSGDPRATAGRDDAAARGRPLEGDGVGRSARRATAAGPRRSGRSARRGPARETLTSDRGSAVSPRSGRAPAIEAVGQQARHHGVSLLREVAFIDEQVGAIGKRGLHVDRERARRGRDLEQLAVVGGNEAPPPPCRARASRWVRDKDASAGRPPLHARAPSSRTL